MKDDYRQCCCITDEQCKLVFYMLQESESCDHLYYSIGIIVMFLQWHTMSPWLSWNRSIACFASIVSFLVEIQHRFFIKLGSRTYHPSPNLMPAYRANPGLSTVTGWMISGMNVFISPWGKRGTKLQDTQTFGFIDKTELEHNNSCAFLSDCWLLLQWSWNNRVFWKGLDFPTEITLRLLPSESSLRDNIFRILMVFLLHGNSLII